MSHSAQHNPGKALFIASVFIPSENNRDLYAIQKRFIEKHTEVPFTYRAVLNGIPPDGFDPADIVMLSDRETLKHGAALDLVVQHFRQNRHASYLILDCDAMPVQRGWHGILLRQMRRFGKKFAAPVRTENLENHPHPCAFFMLDEILGDSRLLFRKAPPRETPAMGVGAPFWRENYMGYPISDTGVAITEMKDLWYPMMRSNFINLHPVVSAIYHHLFYHHGAGARRTTGFRCMEQFPYTHYFDSDKDSEKAVEQRDVLYRLFVQDPEGFMDRLMGRRDPHVCRWLTPRRKSGELLRGSE